MNNYAKNQFWAISNDGMNKLLAAEIPTEARAVISAEKPENATDTDWLRERLSIYFNQRQEMSLSDGIAEIHLYGPMLSDAAPLDLAMGATSYEEIRADIAAANADPSIGAIVLRVNTPGGTVSGIEETYLAIQNSIKPVFAYNEGYATSAGYYLIAPTKAIAASASSMTGNIGTVLDMWDFTGMYEALGAKRTVMVNDGADLKGTHRDSPMTDSQREFLQGQINAMGDLFHERVRESRPDIDDEMVRAGWYMPDEAAELGMIDLKGSLEDFKTLIKEDLTLGDRD